MSKNISTNNHPGPVNLVNIYTCTQATAVRQLVAGTSYGTKQISEGISCSSCINIQTTIFLAGLVVTRTFARRSTQKVIYLCTV
jgi:hypothetical protein